jgi:hypothetical protein
MNRTELFGACEHRKRPHLDAEILWMFADNSGGDERRRVAHAFALKVFSEKVLLFGQEANATSGAARFADGAEQIFDGAFTLIIREQA